MKRLILLAMTLACGPAFAQNSTVPLVTFEAILARDVLHQIGILAPNGLPALDAFGGLAVAGSLSVGSAPTVYTSIFPGVTFGDQASSSFVNPSNMTTNQQTGFASYFRNQASAVGIGHNAVGFFTAGTAEVNGAASWGINTLLQDAATRAIGTGTSRVLVNEFDFNVMNPGTQVIGLSVGGNSLAQPATSNGFIVNSLGAGIRWGGAFVSIDGAAQYGISIGTNLTTGADVPSQLTSMAYRDHTGTKQQATLQAVSANNGTAGFLSLTSTGGVDLSLNGRLLYAGGINVSGGITANGLPTCASSPPSGSVCRDVSTTPATLKLTP
jgi:hypothetical protein